MTLRPHLLLCGVICAALTTSAQAQVLFSSSFDTAAGWNAATSLGPDTAATFGFDYSDPLGVAIPSNGGPDTLALKLEANIVSPGDANAISVVTTGSYSDHYTVEFDSWFNYVGSLSGSGISGGGAGSTEFGGAVVGNDGVANAYSDGAIVTFTGDAGSGVDLSARIEGSVGLGLGDAAFNGALTGLNHPNIDSELGLFPSTAAPAAQLANFPSQHDMTRAGAAGFGWRSWRIVVDANADTAHFFVDGVFVVELNTGTTGGAGFDGGGHAGVAYADFFNSVAGDADVTFGLFDNFVVTQIPEPTSLVLVGFAATMLGFRRRSD